MICLGSLKDTDKISDGSLLNLLDVLLSNQTDAATKKKILKDNFDIPMTEQMERRMDEMCNLSKGVMAEGVEQGILTSLKNLIANMHFSTEQAMEALGIKPEEQQKYSSLLTK